MPPAAVTGLSSQPPDLIQLSTYGRGAFELDRNGVTLIFVANTNDSGTGSLRQAILNSNANAGLDEICFSIPGSGLHTISPTTDLPNITGPVTIDATTQPG